MSTEKTYSKIDIRKKFAVGFLLGLSVAVIIWTFFTVKEMKLS